MYTPLAPGYGTIPGSAGDLLVHPDDARRLGMLPPDPTVAAPPDIGAPVAPPPESPVPDMSMPMPPGPNDAPPAIAPTAPVSLAPTEAEAAAVKAAQAAPPVAPAPADTPPPNLSATTYGDVLSEQQAAIRDRAQADQQAAVNAAAYEDKQAAAQEARNKEIAAKEAEFAQREADDQKRIADTTALYEAKVKEFADAKVDRNKYKISPMEAIGVALAGIGSAYKGQGDRNPALDLLKAKIDQYVEDGYRAKAALGQEAGMFKDRLGVLQQAASNTLAQKQLAVAGITERTGREIEAIATRMQAGAKRDAVAQLGAAARGEAATALAGAVQLQHAEDAQRLAREQQERESRRQAALGYARLKEDARQFDLNLTDRIAQQEAARNAAIAAATTEADKANAEREVPDLKAADGSSYRARDKEWGSKMAAGFAATQTLNDRISELIRMKKAYGNKAAAMKSAEWQQMQVNVADIQNSLRTAFEMGTLDKGSLEMMGKMMGGDPMRDGAAEALLGNLWQDGAENGLEKLRQNSIDRFNTKAEAMRDPRGPKFQRWEPPKPTIDAAAKDAVDAAAETIQKSKTPDEIRAAGKPGAFWSAAGRVVGDGDTFGGRRKTNKEIAAEQKAADAAAPGLGSISKDQRKALDDLVMVAKGKDASAAERARTTLVGFATQQKRPELAAAALDTIVASGDAAALDAVKRADVAAAEAYGKRKGVAASDAVTEQKIAPKRVEQAVQGAAAQKDPIGYLTERAMKGDRAAAGQLLAASQGQLFGDVVSGLAKPSPAEQRRALQVVDALARARGR